MMTLSRDLGSGITASMRAAWVTNEIRISDLLANHSGLREVAEEIWYGTGYDWQELINRLAEVPITQGFRNQFPVSERDVPRRGRAHSSGDRRIVG